MRREEGIERPVVHGEVAGTHDPCGPPPIGSEDEDAPARKLGADGWPRLVNRADATLGRVAAEERAGAGDRRRGKKARRIGIDRHRSPLACVAVDDDAAAAGRGAVKGMDIAHGRAALAAAEAVEGHG